jgi:hypothetical protein
MLLLALTVAMAVGSPAASENTPKPGPAAASAPLVLSGVWQGREVDDAGVGVRFPTVTFKDKNGTLSYDDSRRGTGTMSVRVEALTVSGSSVRFTVRGPGGKREYKGKWDGTRITGTTTGLEGGAPTTFTLERVVYDDSPRLPFATARASRERSGRERDRENARVVYSPTGGDGDSGGNGSGLVFQSDIARQRGLQKVSGALATVSGAPAVVEAMAEEVAAQCRAGAAEGTPLYDTAPASSSDCDRALVRLRQAVGQIDRVLSQAEDDARVAGLEPGTVRDLRTRYDVDEGDWYRATERVREAEAARRR